MDTGLAQNILLQQRQILSQRQQQSLELLHLPLQELDVRINKELAENPLLEESAPPRSESQTDPSQENPDSENSVNENSGSGLSEEFDAARNLWGDDLPSSGSYAAHDPDEDGDFWSKFSAPPPSMEQQLEAEIGTSSVSERIREIAYVIIGNLDEKGYVASHLADLAMVCDADMDEMEEALRFVQSFDPPGIAARDLSECLYLQLLRKKKLTPLLEKLIQPESLEEIAANHIPRLAAKLSVSVGELKAARAVLQKLDPAPGSELAGRVLKTVDPELEILWNGKEYTVRTPFARERNLFIPDRYEKLLDDPSLSDEDKNYIREKLASARELIKALRLRGDTLSGIGRVLIDTQKEFLEHGMSALKPLTMKQAGEMLGFHETTISRAVSEKLVKTPHGVFKLRDFFSGGFKTESGEDLSARAVQEKLKKLIADEDPHDPLSDDKLAQMLNSEGLNVARRTIAKYRDILKIPSTRLRKQY